MRHYHCRLVKPNMELQPKLPTSTRYGAHMDIGQYGDLNTLQWVENEFDPEPNMVHCEVIYGESTHHRMLSFICCKLMQRLSCLHGPVIHRTMRV